MANGKEEKAGTEDQLRSNAETQLLANPTGLKSPGTGEDIRKALHELQVHQIELEMQNAELIQSRAETEMALDKFTDLYDFAPVCYLTLDHAGVIIAANLSGASILGIDRSCLLGRRFESFLASEVHPAFTVFFRKAFKSLAKETCEVVLQVEANAPLFVQVEALAAASGKECRLALVDVTERKLIESQFLQAQKLESLGILAGGIAHDFNNILMAIFGNVDLALLHLGKESPAVENLTRIQQAAARAADLTKQMLAYSGKGRFIVESLDLNGMIEKMLQMLKVSISKKALIELNLHRPLPLVEADTTQMHQILMNLVINASEATGVAEGRITLTTGDIVCDRNYLNDGHLSENLSEGRYVYLEVTDTGCGMNKDTMAKLFDPFFTTKFAGRGLGLAAVLGIVKGHKGAIKVKSEPGMGTTFRVLLPASELSFEQVRQESNTDDWKGSGTVLLVDDEDEVRGIGAEMLKILGFTPITAKDGREAVMIFKEKPDISLVILDLTMPFMDGNQCFCELSRLDSNVKVIMSSGYNEQDVNQGLVCKGISGFIQKPYSLAALREAIKVVAER